MQEEEASSMLHPFLSHVSISTGLQPSHPFNCPFSSMRDSVNHRIPWTRACPWSTFSKSFFKDIYVGQVRDRIAFSLGLFDLYTMWD
jgi:hypothetical protein